MKTNFRIKDNHALIYNEYFIDLHNCFDFVGVDSWVENEILIKFKKSEGEWVGKDEFTKVVFVCVGLNYHNFENKSNDKDDWDTVNYISFSSPKLRDSENTFESKVTPEFGDDFILGFENGSCFRVNCEQLTLVATK